MPSLEDNDTFPPPQATPLESKDRSILRPLLSHLNADTSWLLSLPIPPSYHRAADQSLLYYHVLIDPWLRGAQADVTRFLSQQWHATPSACQTVEDVQDVIRRIEQDSGEDTSTNTDVAGRGAKNAGNCIDAVVVSHEFTDHMHKETLLEVAKTVPVFASTKAAGIIKSWKHFEKVFEIPRFDKDWRSSSLGPLPQWLGLSRVAYPGADMLYYHSAVMIAFSSDGSRNEAEVVIYTPHGISTDDVAPVAKAEPSIQTLALLHGLQDIKFGAQLNMGAHNGLKVQRLLKSKYWVGTHDEVKKGGGIVSWFLKRKMISLKEAIEKERQDRGGRLKGTDLESLEDVRFEEVGNGENLVLV